jgi:hypothetical protein
MLRQIEGVELLPENAGISGLAWYLLHMAKKKASGEVATIEQIERSIHVIRGATGNAGLRLGGSLWSADAPTQ